MERIIITVIAGGILSGLALHEAVYSVPLILAQILIWIATLLTLLSGVEYVWANRHFLAGEK